MHAGTTGRLPLQSAGMLPDGFADRLQNGDAISPFGRPYVIVARKIEANYPATAVVTESGATLEEKLTAVGLENSQPSVLELSRSVAQAAATRHDVFAGTIESGVLTARGTGDSFEKDLSAYFTGPFPQAVPVALVNFRDLEPYVDDPNDPNNPNVVRRKVYTSCPYTLNPGHGFCSSHADPPFDTYYAGTRHEPYGPIRACDSPQLKPIGPGGFISGGATRQTVLYRGTDCEEGEDTCEGYVETGVVTINNQTVASATCERMSWENGTPVYYTNPNPPAMSVCCQWHWEPGIPWTPGME